MSTTVGGHAQPNIRLAGPESPPPATTAMGWGNSAPLALAAFAVPTFMLSAVNVGWVNAAVEPMIFAVAFLSGGVAQLIAGVIQLRTGRTLPGVLFSMYAALWLSLFAFAEFFVKEVPAAQVGHALGLLLFSFGVGGYLVLMAGALAAYLSCAELCEAAYHRVVLPIWPLAKS